MIKVLIERHIAPDLADHYFQVARRTLQQAMQSHGFISGESMKNAHDPNHRLVIAAYNDISDWSRWYHSEERQAMLAEIRPMLLSDEKITIFEHL